MRKLPVAFAWFLAATGGVWAAALTSAPPGAAGASSPGDPYYCPPGAKYCPVPGRDNTTYIDTHFGMDAATGEIRRYTGSQHPDEVVNNLATREEVLYNSPPIDVTNRHVPYPGSPAGAFSAAPVVAAAPPAPPAAPRPAVRASEVADQRPVRQVKADPPVADDRKIPWWKGGMWRNRKSSEDSEDSSGAKSESGPAERSAAAPPVTSDDMWGDEDEYSGYGDPAGFNPSRQYEAGAGQAADPFADPYAGTQAGGFAPSQPYSAPPPSAGGPVYAGDPYTLPNSPGPTSPYQQGYVYPGTNVTYENTYQGGYPQSGPPPQTYQDDPFATPAPSTAYAPAPASPAWDAQPQSGFAMPPPPATASAAAPRGGSAQFDNAVGLVKSGRFAEAKTILQSETAADPGNPAAWRWLADSQYNLLELQDSIDSYTSALHLDPNDYYALRGQGFAYLHRGHELWRKMMEELNAGQRDQAAATFAQAHENYKNALDKLGSCLRRAPNDEEAVYGEAMAAEGASRKLYSNAISYIKLGPENRERAELFAENCLQVINKGIERASDRARGKPGEPGPRALLGGLYLRKAMLYRQLGKNELALAELRNSHSVQKSILDEIDKNNLTAQKGVQNSETYWSEWGGVGAL